MPTLTEKLPLLDQLKQLAEANKLPHAMLFTSREGGGAMQTALALAKYLMCQKRNATSSCNDCNSCLSVDKLTHPDLFLTFPVFNKDSRKKYTSNDFIEPFRKFITAQPYAPATAWIQSLTSENKQGNISAEECKSISSKMMLRPILGGAKILIVWYAEYLGKEGNRLLKLIEEPPKNTYILFVAENTSKILGTILSRTQHYSLPPLDNSMIEQQLMAQGSTAEQAATIAKQAEGNLYKALQFTEQSSLDYFGHLRLWFNALYTSNGVLLSTWLKDCQAMGKEELKGFFLYSERIFEQALRVMHLPEEFWSLTESETRLVKSLIDKGLHETACEKAAAFCSQAAYHLERNVYKKIVVHAISLQIQEALVK